MRRAKVHRKCINDLNKIWPDCTVGRGLHNINACYFSTYICTYSCWKYGIKTFWQRSVQYQPCFGSASATASWKGHLICDNDLVPLLFLQKTTIWSGRIFCIGGYLGIFTRCFIVLLYFISPFQCICWELYILCYIVFVCMLMSWSAFARPK